MPEHLSLKPPPTRDAVLNVLKAQRAKIERWKAARIKEIDAKADLEIVLLERAAHAVVGEATRSEGGPKQRPAGKGKGTAAAAGERRDAIVRLLQERGEALAVSEVKKALRISEFSARSALKRLVEESRAHRVGTGSSTRYESRGSGPQPAVLGDAGPGDPGSLGGRVLAVVQDRGYASLEELSQTSGVSQEVVRRVCGGLIAEGEVRMDRRNGRSVYVFGKAA